MTSKNLFFKLMKEDLKRRIWAIALISLGFFFFYPVVAAFMAGNIKSGMDYAVALKEYTRDLSHWLSFDCGMTVFLMMVSSLICGLSSFSFLNSKSKVDFYHGIPVRREKLYGANYINGILILAVPYGICLAMAVVIGIVNGVEPVGLCQVAVVAYGLHLTYYVLMYAVVILAAMLTGHLVVCFLGTMVLAFYVPTAVVVIATYFSVFFQTFDYDHFFWSQGLRISPVIEYVYQVAQYSDAAVSFWEPLKAWMVSLALAAASGFLYKKRPSETAGRAMTFFISRPIIRVLLVVLSAMGLGVFFWSIRSSMGWAIFGILCGGAICHSVVEIIYNFDFKKLFSHKIQLALCLVVSFFLLAVFRFDLTGYDRYLPRESQVKEAVVCVSALDEWVSYGTTEKTEDGDYFWERKYDEDYAAENMHYRDVENLLDIALEGIRQTQERRNGYYGVYDPYYAGEEKPWINSRVNICYIMKSGRKVYRRYYINFDESMRPAMERLYGNEEYQKGTFPVLNQTADQVASIRYRGKYNKEIYLGKLTDAEKKRFLETFQREFAQLTLEEMEREAPIGIIRFSGILDEEAEKSERGEDVLPDQYEYYDFGDYYEYTSSFSRYGSRENFYPVYPSFTGTLSCLEERGINTDGYASDLDVKWVNVYRDSDPDKGITSAHYMTEDPEEIAQLKKILVVKRLCFYDPLFQSENLEVVLRGQKPREDLEKSVDFRADTEDEEYWSLTMAFPKGKVPAEVLEGLKE